MLIFLSGAKSYPTAIGHSFLDQPDFNGLTQTLAGLFGLPGFIFNHGFGRHIFGPPGYGGIWCRGDTYGLNREHAGYQPWKSDLGGSKFRAPYYGYSVESAPSHGYVYGSFFGKYLLLYFTINFSYFIIFCVSKGVGTPGLTWRYSLCS